MRGLVQRAHALLGYTTRRRLLVTHLALTAAAVLVFSVPLGISYSMNEFHHLAIDSKHTLNEWAGLAEAGDTGADGELAAGLERKREALGVWGAVIAADGRPLATSVDGEALDDLRDSPALAQALGGDRVDGMDYPFTLRPKRMVLAEPVRSDGEVEAAVVASVPTTQLRAGLIRRSLVVALAAGLVLASAALAALYLSRWITRPLHELDQAARGLSLGELSKRAEPDSTAPSELQRVMSTFNAMAAQLSALVQAQRSFVSDAAHQLRNPLFALRVRLDTLEPDGGNAGRADWEAARDEADRLAHILDELLMLARNQGAAVVPERLDLAGAVEQRADAWGPVAAQRGLRIALETERVQGLGSPNALAQVIDNLIDNALKASPRDGTVTLYCRDAGDRVTVGVRDEGPGMTEEQREHATDRFWSGSAAEGGSGSGLGLAIVAQLVQLLGARLSLEPADSGGLDASVHLPPADSPAALEPVPSAATAQGGTASPA